MPQTPANHDVVTNTMGGLRQLIKHAFQFMNGYISLFNRPLADTPPLGSPFPQLEQTKTYQCNVVKFLS
jgi:hypothetical protein